MEYIFSFLATVGAQVVSYYLCKWLDSLLNNHGNDKHDN